MEGKTTKNYQLCQELEDALGGGVLEENPQNFTQELSCIEENLNDKHRRSVQFKKQFQ